jgi:allantoin racemase
MKRLLLINPNTSESITRKLADCARERLAGLCEVQALTARFGSSYISSEVSLAVAQHSVVDAYQWAVEQGSQPDAILIGCFGDPGLFALKEIANCPVLGLAEASMRAAGVLGRFSIVTGGAAWKQPLERLAFSIGLHDQLCGIETVDASGAELAADPEYAKRILLEACREASQSMQSSVQRPLSLILGGAGLLGMAKDLAPHLAMPVLDSVHCALDAVASALATT